MSAVRLVTWNVNSLRARRPRVLDLLAHHAPDVAFAQKLRFLDAAGERVASFGGATLAVLGDFNVAPADLDVSDPAAFAESTHVTPDERSRLAALLAAGPLADAYRHLHPDEVGYTWWDYRAGHFHRKMGLRIDLALVSPDLAGRLTACGIDRDFRKGAKPSDHAPLLVELAAGSAPGSASAVGS